MPTFVTRTRTAWLAPFQPASTLAGAIVSVQVSRIQSPDSRRPAVAPPLPACTSVPRGGLSIVIDVGALVVFTPALSATTTRIG